MIKLEGRVLLFDTVNKNRDMFTKDCKINIPEKVPLLWNFDHTKPPIGIAEVTRDDKGLVAKAETCSDPVTEYALNDILSDGKIGVGGFFTNVVCDRAGDLIVVDEAKLKEVSLTLAPVNDEYYFERIEEIKK